MKSLMMCLSKVRKWDEVDALSEAFSDALENFFLHIYIPVKTPTDSGMPDEYTYVNVGLSDSQLSMVYAALYGGNYLVDPLVLVKTDATDYATSIGRLSKRISAVLLINKLKYLKLIELGGYEFNPLWNVDGTEEYTFLENQGVNDVHTNIATYNGSPKPSMETEYIHRNADNNGSDYSGGVDAFGNTVTGGDKYHTEKKVRQGNIGVTKTTELIEDAKNLFRENVIMEFFKDINNQILVGIYDY